MPSWFGFKNPLVPIVTQVTGLLRARNARRSVSTFEARNLNSVQAHESGLQYIVRARSIGSGGTDARSPARDQPCRVHYTGELALTGELQPSREFIDCARGL